MRSASAFLDSGVFVAYLVGSDSLHEETRELFARPPARWSTSTLVLSETYSWFLHRSGEDAARTFRALLESLEDLEILDPTPDHRRAVWKKLDRHRGLKLTFVDASTLVWLDETGISTVWGIDAHLGIEGADVLPGPPLV